MKAIRRYCLLLLNSHYFSLCFLIGFVLTNNLAACGLFDGLLTKSEFVKANHTHQGCCDFSSFGFIQWSSLSDFDACPSPQLIKTKSSHPLSLLNFNKTRPRGIPAQEPISKNPLLPGTILIFPPYLSTFHDITPFLFYSLKWGKTETIRPPPVH